MRAGEQKLKPTTWDSPVDFHSTLESATQAVRDAKSFGDIVAVFSVFSRYGKVISSETPELVASLEQYIERIQSSPRPAADVLYEFAAMARIARNDAALTTVRDASPQNAHILEMAESVIPDEVRKIIVESGASIIQNNFSGIVSKTQELKNLKEELNGLHKDIYSGKFAEITKKINGKIVASLRSDGVFHVPGYIISGIAEGRMEFAKSEIFGEHMDELIKRIAEMKTSLMMQEKTDNPEYAALYSRMKSLAEGIEVREKETFESVKKALESVSPVSKEGAQTWATENVYIAPNVARKLKKINYPKEQFINDMAEVYRYLGGKLGPVEFILQKGTRRAFARGRSQICLDSDFNKTTLFHECGHLVEHWDRAALAASLSFIKNRAQGAPKSLKVMTGGCYQPGEKAFPDSFIDPYVGKDYQGEASEVFSMALQQMASPAHLANFIEKDPEHFKLFLGVCARQSPELSQKMRDVERKAKETYADREKAKSDRAELRGPWEKALRNAIPDGFSELLKAQQGFAGYAVLQDARKKSQWTLYQISDDGWWRVLYKATLPSATRLAYLHIMNDRRELPVHYETASDATTDFFSFICSDAVPAWFDVEKGLPGLEI